MFKPAVTFFFLLFPLLSFSESFVAGKDYELINQQSTNQSTNHKIAVTEFFSYGCPWCYRIETNLNTWLNQQGNKIEFTRIPVVFNKDWDLYAKAYYTAHLLKQDNKLSPLLFKAIQEERKSLKTNQEMIDFFVAQGVDKATATSAFENSTTVEMQVKAGNSLMATFHISGVPAVVINNQYKTDLQMAGGEQRFFQILDYLVAKASEKKVKAA